MSYSGDLCCICHLRIFSCKRKFQSNLSIKESLIGWVSFELMNSWVVILVKARMGAQKVLFIGLKEPRPPTASSVVV